MKNRMLSFLPLLFFLNTGVSVKNIETVANNEYNDVCVCDLDNYISDGSCWCDSIIMYHSYMYVTKGDREASIEAAAYYLDECVNGS